MKPNARSPKPRAASSKPKAAGPKPKVRRRFASARERAPEIYRLLEQAYPDAHCALDHRNPYELLVATILSAQCTDKRVNMVTPALFAKYPDPESMSVAKPEVLEELIKSTGFFRNKAKSIMGMAAALEAHHGGQVPRTMDELVRLPGVGRKTANVILGNAYGVSEGVVVDTHVGRLAGRLGLTRETDPVKVEQALMALFPRERWTMLAHLLIFHGRRVCDARKPKCGECPLRDVCPSAAV